MDDKIQPCDCLKHRINYFKYVCIPSNLMLCVFQHTLLRRGVHLNPCILTIEILKFKIKFIIFGIRP